jgi:hypothetical protein
VYDLDVKVLAISDVVEPVLYGAGLSSYADDSPRGRAATDS